MNVFSALKVYAGKWQKKAERAFEKEEIDAVAKAVDITRFGYKSKAVKIPTDKGRLNGLELTIIK